MQVQVRFYSFIRFKTGLDEVTVELDEGDTLENLIQQLKIDHGGNLVRYLKAEDRNKLLALFVRNHQILKPDAVLVDGDKLKIMPAISGG